MSAVILMGLKKMGSWLAAVPLYVWVMLCLCIALYVSNGRTEAAQQLAADRLVVINDLNAAAEKTAKAGKEVVTVTVKEYVDRIKYIKGESRVIEKQVPYYIPAGTPDLPGGFRLLHDAAAQGRAIAAGTGPDNGAPVTVADAATTVAANYGQCLQDKAKVVFFQDLYERLRAEYGVE